MISLFKYSKLILIISLLGVAFFSLNFFRLSYDTRLIYDSKRIFVCGLLIVTSLLLIVLPTLRITLSNRLQTIDPTVKSLFVIMLMSALIANLTGLYFFRAQTDYFYFIGLLFLCVLLSISASNNRVRIYNYFIILSLFLFVSVMIGHWLNLYIGKEPTIHSVLSYVNPRMLNQVQIWLIVPVFYLAVIYKGNSRKNLFFLGVTSASFSVFFATDGRGVFISAVTAIILFSVADKLLRKNVLIILAQSLILGYVINILFLTKLPSYLMLGDLYHFDQSIRLSSSGRLTMWIDALKMSSFWGYGGDAFVCNAPDIADRPHNSIILTLFNWGVFASTSYLLLLLTALKAVFTTRYRSERVAIISVLAGFGYSLVSGVLDSPLSQLMAVISIALYWSIWCRNNKSSSNTYQPKIHIATYFIIMLSILVISLTANRVIAKVSNGYSQQNTETRLKPQFWLGDSCSDEVPYLLIDRTAN
ncbi:hypothetical protein L4D09_25605 [Photobacterium makurazakiensis]|uniref:hypothetical protein n=1 Tax=Photobacterium makurazakiensis TaxID=2910234 RepID=UPI003D13A663